MPKKLPDALSLVIRTILGDARSLPNDWDCEDTEAMDHACFLIGDSYRKASTDNERKPWAMLWQLFKG